MNRNDHQLTGVQAEHPSEAEVLRHQARSDVR